jgi:hypothetical protein
MSHSFKNYPAKPCFSQFKEPLSASDYISSKKIKYSFCSPNICEPNKNVYSESNLLMLKKANYYALNPLNRINKNQLYINLITKLQLNDDIPVITNNTSGFAPSIIDPTLQDPFIEYTIDISGNLFGNDICTINNWENYIVYNGAKSIL